MDLLKCVLLSKACVMSMKGVVKMFGVIWEIKWVAENLLGIYVIVLVNLYTCNDLIMSIWDIFGCGENGMSFIKYMCKIRWWKVQNSWCIRNRPSVNSMCWLMRICIIVWKWVMKLHLGMFLMVWYVEKM